MIYMSTTIKSREEIDVEALLSPVWNAELFNCYCHSFDEVVDQLAIALGCKWMFARELACLAEKFGSIVIYNGNKSECNRIVGVLRSIGIQAEVNEARNR